MKQFTTILSIMLAGLVATSLYAQDYWTKKNDFPGKGRYAGSAFSIGDKAYMGLGSNDAGYLIDFWEYDPVADVWTQKADFEGPIRNSATGFSIADKGYITAGSHTPGDVGWSWYHDLWQYDPVTNDWIEKEGFHALGRHAAVGFSIGNKGYVGTGTYRVDRYHPAIYLDDFWEYDPATDTWQQKARVPEQGRTSATGVSVGNKGYVGLGVYYYDTRLKDWWEFDPLADSWTRKADFGGTQRYGASGFTLGDRAYVGIGSYYSALKDLWEYNPATDTWCRKADYPQDIYGPVAFSVGSKGYVATGSWGSTYSPAVYEYTASPLEVTIPDAYAVTPGGEANTIYIGYGPTSITLTAEVSGGKPPYLFHWDDGTKMATRTVSPDTVGTYTYSVTVEDGKGCRDSYEKTVVVKDIRCGDKMDKMMVCMAPPGNSDHKIQTCVNPNAVAHLLEMGSYLGTCNSGSLAEVIVYPNPNNGSFSVQIRNALSSVQIIVTDRHGKVVARHSVNADSEIQTLNVNLGDAPPGLYFVKVIQGQRLSTHKIFVRR